MVRQSEKAGIVLYCRFGEYLEAFVTIQFIMGMPQKVFDKFCEEDEKQTSASARRKAIIVEAKFQSSILERERDSINYIGNNTRTQRCQAVATTTAKITLAEESTTVAAAETRVKQRRRHVRIASGAIVSQ